MRGQSGTVQGKATTRSRLAAAAFSFGVGSSLCAGNALGQGVPTAASDARDTSDARGTSDTSDASDGAVRTAAESEHSDASPPPASSDEAPVASEPVQPNDAAIESKPETRPLPPSKAVSAKATATAGAQPLFGTFEGTYGSSGFSSGFSSGPTGGFYLGGELSIVRQFQEFTWLGAYVDGVYDFGREQTRLSVGPEFGWSALGIDGGYLLAIDVAGVHHGLTARPLLTMGFVSAYGRVSHLFGVNSTWLEAGLLLKYPVEF